MSVNASDSLVFLIKAVPSSGRQAWKLDKSGILKCYLKSAPERGKANSELVKLIAKAIQAPITNVEILAGATSRNKKVRILTRLSYEHLLAALGIENQIKIF